MAAGEVDAGNLQIASINVALVERDAAVGAYLFVAAAPLAVVGAMSGELSPLVGRRVFLMQPLRHIVQQGVENIQALLCAQLHKIAFPVLLSIFGAFYHICRGRLEY